MRSVGKSVGWILLGVAVVAAAGFAIQQWHSERVVRAECDAIVERARPLATDPDKLSQAAVELRRAIKLDPDHVPALLLYGEVCLGLALLDEAGLHLAHASAITEGALHAEAEVRLGLVHHRRYGGSKKDEDFRAARDALFEAQKEPTTQAAAMYGLAMLFLEKGRNYDLAKALGLLKSLVEHHPTSVEAGQAKELLDALSGKPADTPAEKPAQKPAGE